MKKNQELNPLELGKLIVGMREAYAKGENAMAFSREALAEYYGGEVNQRIATLVAYDLQAGNYVARVRKYYEFNKDWCKQLADLIDPVIPDNGTLLEVGVGEATTLSGVLNNLGEKVQGSFGFDISWSRIKVANDWLIEKSQQSKLFVGDLFHIPLADNSIDVVYSSHSLEPNGGHEERLVAECLRVARKSVVLVEPIYELASAEAQERMRHHGYVRGLREVAEVLDCVIEDYRLLECVGNPLNPSGVLKIRKAGNSSAVNEISDRSYWQCPLTGSALVEHADYFMSKGTGIVYPILNGVPLLRPEHAVVASLI
jgi:ubiquinone/menaquinone biosynthesis C-methylase UbiE